MAVQQLQTVQFLLSFEIVDSLHQLCGTQAETAAVTAGLDTGPA